MLNTLWEILDMLDMEVVGGQVMIDSGASELFTEMQLGAMPGHFHSL